MDEKYVTGGKNWLDGWEITGHEDESQDTQGNPLEEFTNRATERGR